MGTKLDQHFLAIGACQSGRDWVAANCATASECWQKLIDEGRIEWLLWWYVRDRGFDAKAEAVARRMVMRSVEYAAKAMDAAKLPERAKALRAISDTATFVEIRSAAYAAADAADAANAFRAALAAYAANAAWDAYAAHAAADRARAAADAADAADTAYAAAYAANGAAAEQKKQIADILDILECPWTEATT